MSGFEISLNIVQQKEIGWYLQLKVSEGNLYLLRTTGPRVCVMCLQKEEYPL